jgi:hypothetical protein
MIIQKALGVLAQDKIKAIIAHLRLLRVEKL